MSANRISKPKPDFQDTTTLQSIVQSKMLGLIGFNDLPIVSDIRFLIDHAFWTIGTTGS